MVFAFYSYQKGGLSFSFFFRFALFFFWALHEIALLAGFLAGLIYLLDLIPRIPPHQLSVSADYIRPESV